MATGDTAAGDEAREQPEQDELLDVTFERKAMYALSAGAVVGSVLPWYSLLGVTVFGFEGDGVITLVAGLVVAGLLRYVDSRMRQVYTAIAGGMLISLVATYHVTGVSAIGVYVTLFSGVGLVGVGVSVWRKTTE